MFNMFSEQVHLLHLWVVQVGLLTHHYQEGPVLLVFQAYHPFLGDPIN